MWIAKKKTSEWMRVKSIVRKGWFWLRPQVHCLKILVLHIKHKPKGAVEQMGGAWHVSTCVYIHMCMYIYSSVYREIKTQASPLSCCVLGIFFSVTCWMRTGYWLTYICPIMENSGFPLIDHRVLKLGQTFKTHPSSVENYWYFHSKGPLILFFKGSGK